MEPHKTSRKWKPRISGLIDFHLDSSESAELHGERADGHAHRRIRRGLEMIAFRDPVEELPVVDELEVAA